MEKTWDKAYLWKNAEAALAYLEAYTDTDNEFWFYHIYVYWKIMLFLPSVQEGTGLNQIWIDKLKCLLPFNFNAGKYQYDCDTSLFNGF